MASVIRGSDNFDSLIHQGLGVNQTWQDVTASRSAGVTYTNSTGKPIMIAVSPNVSVTAGTMSFTLSGIVYTVITHSSQMSFTLIIPNGGTYALGGSVQYIGKWLELR